MTFSGMKNRPQIMKCNVKRFKNAVIEVWNLHYQQSIRYQFYKIMLKIEIFFLQSLKKIRISVKRICKILAQNYFKY